MARTRIVTNAFEAYLEDKKVSDGEMAEYLGVAKKTFILMRQKPLNIKLQYAIKLARYFNEYAYYFIDHVLVSDLLDGKTEIESEDTDWDLKVVKEMKDESVKILHNENARQQASEAQESFKTLKKGEFLKGNETTTQKVEKVKTVKHPTKIDPDTGVMVLIDEKED